jgi:hypothetical protein
MNNNDLYTDNPAKEKGDSLEMAVEHIFRVANFPTERNVLIAKYEIDIKATIGDRTLIVECKNYQNSSLTIRNLVHQWNSKNELIKAHKIIIVLAGLNIKDTDYALASDFNIELWSQEDLADLFNLSLKPHELRERLLDKISLEPITISERYRDSITYLVIKPLLSNQSILEEKLYWYFNKWLRAHILTELQMDITTEEDRAKLIEIFEGTKTKKGFLNISRKRKEKDYWNAVLDQLTNQDILDSDRQNTYLSYMNDLMQEYNSQQEFFKGDDYLAKARKLIASRLQNAVFLDQHCEFKTPGMNNKVIVRYLNNGGFSIQITDISEVQGNILNWILTSEYKAKPDLVTKSMNYFWLCSSYGETAEKVFRIFTEFYEISNNASIQDMAL